MSVPPPRVEDIFPRRGQNTAKLVFCAAKVLFIFHLTSFLYGYFKKSPYAEIVPYTEIYHVY